MEAKSIRGPVHLQVQTYWEHIGPRGEAPGRSTAWVQQSQAGGYRAGMPYSRTMATRAKPDPSTAGQMTLLRQPSLRWKGEAIDFPAKGFALAALLSMEPEGRMSRQQIRDYLWGSFDQHRAANSLRQLLVRVRAVERRLGARLLEVTDTQVALDAAELEVDLAKFGRLDVNEAASKRVWGALHAMVRAYSGGVLGGSSINEPQFEEWLGRTDQTLQAKVLQAASILIDHSGTLDAQGRIELAQQLLAWNPGQELACRTLMEAFCSQGKRTLALRAYERCRAVLREEFGVKPEVATRRLAASLGLIEPNKKWAVAARLPDHQRGVGNPRVMVLPPIVVDDASRHAARCIRARGGCDLRAGTFQQLRGDRTAHRFLLVSQRS